MWFKNLFFYRFTKAFTIDATALEAALSEWVFTPCSNQEPERIGWSAPIDNEDAPLVHVCGKYWLICLSSQERILPSSVVNEQVAINAAEIEATQHRKVSRKEKAELKELVVQELLPRAFTRTVKHYAYICPSKAYMVINTSSPNLADTLTGLLRKSIGSLPIRVPAVNDGPATIMTAWLSEEIPTPASFALDEESELVTHGEERANIKYKGMALGKDQLEQNKALGFQVKQLAVTWEDKLSFVLTDSLCIKRLRFLDVLQDKMDDTNAEGAAEKLDAGLYIMASEVDRLLPSLLEAFGGEDTTAIVH